MAKNVLLRARRKIINLFDRATLEDISTHAKPWLFDTPNLRQQIIIDWPEERIKNCIKNLMDEAHDRF